MQAWNARLYDALELAFAAVERLGMPVAIAAWGSVFLGSIAMGLLLRRTALGGRWAPALAVGGVSLAAHLLDYHITLRLSPTLALEANPIWRIVIDHSSIGFAKLYALSGKLLLSVLSFELYAYYLVQRERLFPHDAKSLVSFWRGFGARGGHALLPRGANLFNFFAFSFALIGPFLFYVSFLNLSVQDPHYLRLPSLPLALVLWLSVLTAAYFTTTYRAFRVRRAPAGGGP